MPIIKIVSGAQTGVDRAGLDAAIAGTTASLRVKNTTSKDGLMSKSGKFEARVQDQLFLDGISIGTILVNRKTGREVAVENVVRDRRKVSYMGGRENRQLITSTDMRLLRKSYKIKAVADG